MSKGLRFYTREELNALHQLAVSEAPVNKKLLEQFCKDYNRSFHSAGLKVYEFRKKLNIGNAKPPRNKTVMPKADLVKDSSVAKISKNEFKIPVNNWNITNENGQMFLNIKF